MLIHNQFLAGFCLIAVISVASADPNILRSVAQVRVTGYDVEFQNPWQKGSGSEFSGSAVLIDDDRLITNAHVVSQPLRIEVKRGDSNRWYKADIRFVSDAADLAILIVKDKSFYVGGAPVAIGNDIPMGSKLTVVGFPIGGDSVSTTEGILSRTEVTSYAYSGMQNLTYQIDAAINSGNSGGAVLHNGKLVAISAQAFDDAQNIGYGIPVPVINQFLTDIKDGTVDGVPILPFAAQPISNSAQRELYGIGDSNALRVTLSAGHEDLRCLAEGDIVLSVEGSPIGSDGRIQLDKMGFVSINYLASSKQVGDSLDFEVAGKGKNRIVSCKLDWTWQKVFAVTPVTYNYRPVWAQVGGIVMVEMTDEIFEYLSDNEIALKEGVTDTEIALQSGTPQDPNRYLFVVNVLRDELNDGYEVTGLLLNTFNGVAVRNIEHLNQLLASNSSPWVELGFNNGESAAFRSADLPLLNEQLQQEYGF